MWADTTFESLQKMSADDAYLHFDPAAPFIDQVCSATDRVIKKLNETAESKNDSICLDTCTEELVKNIDDNHLYMLVDHFIRKAYIPYVSDMQAENLSEYNHYLTMFDDGVEAEDVLRLIFYDIAQFRAKHPDTELDTLLEAITELIEFSEDVPPPIVYIPPSTDGVLESVDKGDMDDGSMDDGDMS